MLPVERVSDSDRNAAIKAVDAALADGRIVQADRDHRVSQVRGAQTPSELQMVTHDLVHREPTWTTYTPPPEVSEVPTAPEVSSPPVTYGPPTTSSPEVARLFGKRRSSGAGCLAVPFLFVLLFFGGVVTTMIGTFSGSDEPDFSYEFDGPTPFELPDLDDLEPTAPLLFTNSGFTKMRGALQRETGSTQVFSADIYPRYAALEVPAEPTGARALRYVYNGELGEPTKDRSDLERFDLARIDPQVVSGLVQRVRRLVEDPVSWYVAIRRPGGTPLDDGAWLTAHVSNEFGESGYLAATLDGTVVRRSVSE